MCVGNETSAGRGAGGSRGGRSARGVTRRAVGVREGGSARAGKWAAASARRRASARLRRKERACCLVREEGAATASGAAIGGVGGTRGAATGGVGRTREDVCGKRIHTSAPCGGTKGMGAVVVGWGVGSWRVERAVRRSPGRRLGRLGAVCRRGEGPGCWAESEPEVDGTGRPLEQTKRSGGIRLCLVLAVPRREDMREDRAPLPEGWKPSPPAWPPSSRGRERPTTVRLSILE